MEKLENFIMTSDFQQGEGNESYHLNTLLDTLDAMARLTSGDIMPHRTIFT